MNLDLGALRAAAGIGVAGNFAGHLEQAGEAGDFVSVAAPAEAPKGIFPWYVPGAAGFLAQFPLSTDAIALPAGAADLQIEPEAAVLFDLDYDETGTVTALRPTALAAFNDCSIRREGARKISEKKNWGPASKGIAATAFAIADLEPDGDTANLRLASFLRRDDVAEAYGVDSPLAGYSYYGATLLAWLVDRLAHQHGADDTPLEDVGALLRDGGRPPTVVVGIGATRYTPFGASTYLVAGDEAIVIVYDATVTAPDDLAQAVARGAEDALPAASVLRQRVA